MDERITNRVDKLAPSYDVMFMVVKERRERI